MWISLNLSQCAMVCFARSASLFGNVLFFLNPIDLYLDLSFDVTIVKAYNDCWKSNASGAFSKCVLNLIQY